LSAFEIILRLLLKDLTASKNISFEDIWPHDSTKKTIFSPGEISTAFASSKNESI